MKLGSNRFESNRSCRRVGYAGAVCLGAVLATSAALAEEPAPYPCEKVANETAQRLGTSVNQKGQNEGEYSYADVNGAKVRFACPSGRQRFPRLSLSWAAAYPPKAFWDTVSSAGTVLTIASARRVKLAAHECHKAAALAEGKPAAV